MSAIPDARPLHNTEEKVLDANMLVVGDHVIYTRPQGVCVNAEGDVVSGAHGLDANVHACAYISIFWSVLTYTCQVDELGQGDQTVWIHWWSPGAMRSLGGR